MNIKEKYRYFLKRCIFHKVLCIYDIDIICYNNYKCDVCKVRQEKEIKLNNIIKDFIRDNFK